MTRTIEHRLSSDLYLSKAQRFLPLAFWLHNKGWMSFVTGIIHTEGTIAFLFNCVSVGVRFSVRGDLQAFWYFIIDEKNRFYFSPVKSIDEFTFILMQPYVSIICGS